MSESPKAVSVFVLTLALMGVFAVVVGMGWGTWYANRIATKAEVAVWVGTLDRAGYAARMDDSHRVRRAGWMAGAFGGILVVAGTAGYVACRRKEREVE